MLSLIATSYEPYLAARPSYRILSGGQIPDNPRIYSRGPLRYTNGIAGRDVGPMAVNPGLCADNPVEGLSGLFTQNIIS